MAGGDVAIEEAYWDLVVTDIRDTLAILRPVYDESDGIDGYVSVEVDPASPATPRHIEASARHLRDTDRRARTSS